MSEPQIKLITKKEFEDVKDKYEDISPNAQTVIDSAKNDLDVIALQTVEGSGYKILDAKILNENNEEELIKLFRDGSINNK